MTLPFLIRAATIITLVIFIAYAVSLYVLYSQLSRYKNYWISQNQKTIASGNIGYVALGDSAAQGVGATSADKGYVGLIAKELSGRKGKQAGLVNLSKSGAKVSDALKDQIPELNKLKIGQNTVVTVEIGANDIVNFDAKKFENEMSEFMEALPRQTLIADIPYFGGSRLKSKESEVKNANEIMYRLADQHGFKLVPLHEQMQKNDSVLTLAADLFHPSNKAYRENWAKVFIDRL